MSIKQAFLALLAQQPMHGYQLRQEFEARTGSTWPLNIGQAYTTLQRLERDGLVTAIEDDNQNEAPERFALTDLGVQAVAHWWASPVERSTPTRDELAIKLALAVTIPGVDVPKVVQTQRNATLRTLRDFTRLKRSADPNQPDGLAWLLVLDSLIFQAEAEVRWLDHIETTVMRAASKQPKAAAQPKTGFRNAEPAHAATIKPNQKVKL